MNTQNESDPKATAIKCRKIKKKKMQNLIKTTKKTYPELFD